MIYVDILWVISIDLKTVFHQSSYERTPYRLLLTDTFLEIPDSETSEDAL